MKITVHAKPGSQRVGVEQVKEEEFIVRVRERAVDGKANDAIQEALARHFHVPKSRVVLVRGGAGRIKFFSIL